MENIMLPKPHKIIRVVKETQAEYTFRVECEDAPKHGQFYMLSIPKIGEAHTGERHRQSPFGGWGGLLFVKIRQIVQIEKRVSVAERLSGVTGDVYLYFRKY